MVKIFASFSAEIWEANIPPAPLGSDRPACEYTSVELRWIYKKRRTDRHLCFRKQKLYLSKSRSRENGVCAMAIPVMEFQVRTWYKFSWAFFLNMNLFKRKFSIFKNRILASSQKKGIFIFNIWFWHIFSLVKIWSFFWNGSIFGKSLLEFVSPDQSYTYQVL